MKEFYPSEVTDESHKELLAIAKWYNEKFGHNITVVGGWAAYLYHHGLGSKDIDLVFLHHATLRESLETYMKHNGYTLEKGGNSEWSFVKHVAGTEVIVDAVDSAARPPVTGTKANVIWKWTHNEDHVDRHKLENRAEIFVPKPELLVYYKFGGMLGRSNALRTIVDPMEAARYMSKVQKDVYDAGMILKGGEYVDVEKLWLFMTASGLMDYRDDISDLLEGFNKDEEVGQFIWDLRHALIGVDSRNRNFQELEQDFLADYGNESGLLGTLPSYQSDFPEIFFHGVDLAMEQISLLVDTKKIIQRLTKLSKIIDGSKELHEYIWRRHQKQVINLCKNKNSAIRETAKQLQGTITGVPEGSQKSTG